MVTPYKSTHFRDFKQALIPVIHYGCLVTSVVMCGENEKIDPQTMDREHDWLMRWRKACDKLT